MIKAIIAGLGFGIALQLLERAIGLPAAGAIVLVGAVLSARWVMA